MSMLDIIRKAGAGAVEAGQPVAVMFGTATKTNPLEVNVEQRLTLSEDFLIVTDRAKESINAGDGVVLLRVQGGQQFVVLDKVVG